MQQVRYLVDTGRSGRDVCYSRLRTSGCICTLVALFPHVPVARENFSRSKLPGNACCGSRVAMRSIE